MKKILLIVGAVVLLAAAVGGAFYGGIQYQKNQVSQAQANFLQARGGGQGQFPGGGMQLPSDLQAPSDGQMPSAVMGMGRGGGVMGTVKSIDGDTLTLSTAEDVTTVILGENLTIQMTVNGSVSDLTAGTRILVSGERDEDGSLTATIIQIISSDFPTDAPSAP
jgi:hypothetical protein